MRLLEGTNAEHTIVEENVQTNPVRGRSQAQFTAASNIPLSSLPNSSNETQRQSRCLEDDEEDDDDDLRNGETHSQHSQIPDWNETIEFDEQEKVQIRVKNGDLCPIGEKNWHKVDKVYKADIIALVRQKFVLPPNEIVNKKLMRCVGKAWRNHRYLLKKQYKVPGKTKQNVKDKVPDHVIRDQWINLVNYWFFDECQDTAKALIAEHMTDGASAKDVEDEVFHELIYDSQSDQDKKYQRIVGYGMGVTYNQVFGVNGEIRKRDCVSRDNSNEEVVMLRARLQA
ncbi:hypothetical protein Cgig2_020076 [Carnegiea gigantea]|uniref:Transposase n=1 Tax=Carnegiea gigantea TaxID=171969 RepID=A0A9Q1QHQ6_9CARY|nr:hypothetical protein Cgig2_020076 [Carnegiea gigantea]